MRFSSRAGFIILVLMASSLTLSGARAQTPDMPASQEVAPSDPAGIAPVPVPRAPQPALPADATAHAIPGLKLEDPPAVQANAPPIGLWRGGMTMLVVTTRAIEGKRGEGKQLEKPWFGSARAKMPAAARAILYPPSRSFLNRVNPLSSKEWNIAAVEPIAGEYAQGVAGQAQGRDVLLFVHGFNESFESAAASYAELVAGIGFSGAPILFTWPSANALFDYVSDRDSALWSRDALEDTITALAQDATIGRVHIVAHSMGGLLALEALRSVNDRLGGGLHDRMGAIVLANPDIDLDLFKRQMHRMAGLAPKITVIVSAKDRALALSSSIAGGFKRVGAAGQTAIGGTGVKVVDASEFGSGFVKHDMFVTDVEVRGVVRRAIETATGPG